jgi:hypothetical protein
MIDTCGKKRKTKNEKRKTKNEKRKAKKKEERKQQMKGKNVAIRTVGVLAVLGRRGALGRVGAQVVTVGVVLVHGGEGVAGEGTPGTGEAGLGPVLLVAGAGLRALVGREAAHVLGELVGPGHVVPTGIPGRPEAARVVQIVVLELDERGLAALGDGGARGAVGPVAAGARCHRAHRVVQVLLELGAAARARARGRVRRSAGRRAAAATAAAASAAAAATSARHTVRGRGARRTGVARPEWAPQVREVERRRGAPKIHLRGDRLAAVCLKTTPRPPFAGALRPPLSPISRRSPRLTAKVGLLPRAPTRAYAHGSGPRTILLTPRVGQLRLGVRLASLVRAALPRRRPIHMARGRLG